MKNSILALAVSSFFMYMLFNIPKEPGLLAQTVSSNFSQMLQGNTRTQSREKMPIAYASEIPNKGEFTQPTWYNIKKYALPMIPKDCRQVREDANSINNVSLQDAESYLNKLSVYCPHMDKAKHILNTATELFSEEAI